MSGPVEISSSTDNVAQGSPVDSFSFDSLHTTALAQFEGTPAPQEQAAEPVVESTPVVVPDPVTNVETTSEAKLAQLADTDLVTVTVDGQEVTLPWKEARSGLMRQQHYTKEMQGLARQKAELAAARTADAELQTQHKAMLSLLQDESSMAQFLQARFPQLVAKAQQAQANTDAALNPLDPDDIPTVGQVQALQRTQERTQAELMAALRQEMQTELAKTEQTAIQKIQLQQDTAKLTSELNTTINGLFAEHPYLKKINPQAEQVARYEVSLMQPATPEAAHEAFRQVIGGMVEEFKAAVAATTKSAVLNKETLVKNNIQPTGGFPPQPVPVTLTKDGKVDWAAASAAALAAWTK
jgi:hypothetical protein